MKTDNNKDGVTPKIKPLTNGPYYLINNMEPKIVNNLLNFDGEPLSTIAGVALCRCGASKNKPFCDGSHNIIGFSSKNKSHEENNDTNNLPVKDKRRDYHGKEITIHDNRKICSHAAECISNLPSVFKLGSKPWINADGSKIQDIINAVRKCPSGALSYSINGDEYKDRTEHSKPTVTVLRNGPYHITGGIELLGEDIQFGQGASKEHYTLCRCGSSENKPFCDGTHKRINFTDG